MIRIFNTLRATGVLVFCLALGSCFSLPASKGADIYQLKATTPSPAVKENTAGHATVLAVTLPRVPAGYDRDRIALALDGGRRLDYYRGARWPAPLPATLHGVIIQSLRSAIPTATIDNDETLGSRATHRLDVEVIDFTPVYLEAEKPPVVQVTLHLILTGLKDGKIVSDVTLSSHQPVTQNKMSSVTAALEAGLNQVLVNALPRLAL